MKYPDDILKLQSPRGFIDRYWKNLGEREFKYYADAYRFTEMEYEQYYGKRRYSGYESFRVVLHKSKKKA